MDPAFLDQLRCPIDPKREAMLVSEDGHLRCFRCSVQFPVRQGLPILITEEATLPEGKRELSQLSCRKKSHSSR